MADASPRAALERILNEQQPESILAIGCLDHLAAAGHLAGAARARFRALPAEEALEALPETGRQDLVILEQALESLSRRDGEVLLSRLRDLFARRVLAAVQPGGAWQHGDLAAFGFVRLTEMQSSPPHVVLYGFDIATYKTTPDWLNPQYWANPELWDKYRW